MSSRSKNENKLLQLKENSLIMADFLKSVNELANEFVDDLNSPTYSSYSDKDKENINELYREEVKEMVLSNSQKFILE